MIKRTFEAQAINSVINHPEVWKWVALPGMEGIDVTPLVEDTNNVLLMDGPHGGVLFHCLETGVYEAHTQFLPTYRGAKALRSTREAVEWMFTCTDAMELLTKVPVHNKAADVWARLVGGRYEYTRKDAWPIAGGQKVDIKHYALRYNDWLWGPYAVGLEHIGSAFHDTLEAQLKSHDNHPNDSAHNRAVGSCVAMLKGGQVAKGIVLYNRWATFAGYWPISLVSTNPLVIDIGNALVMPSGDTFIVKEQEV